MHRFHVRIVREPVNDVNDAKHNKHNSIDNKQPRKGIIILAKQYRISSILLHHTHDILYDLPKLIAIVCHNTQNELLFYGPGKTATIKLPLRRTLLRFVALFNKQVKSYPSFEKVKHSINKTFFCCFCSRNIP
jgi:hypothetical protein